MDFIKKQFLDSGWVGVGGENNFPRMLSCRNFKLKLDAKNGRA